MTLGLKPKKYQKKNPQLSDRCLSLFARLKTQLRHLGGTTADLFWCEHRALWEAKGHIHRFYYTQRFTDICCYFTPLFYTYCCTDCFFFLLWWRFVPAAAAANGFIFTPSHVSFKHSKNCLECPPPHPHPTPTDRPEGKNSTGRDAGRLSLLHAIAAWMDHFKGGACKWATDWNTISKLMHVSSVGAFDNIEEKEPVPARSRKHCLLSSAAASIVVLYACCSASVLLFITI